MKAHATSIVDPAAVVADDVEIGPFCVVGPKVRIGAGCRLVGRVILTGPIAAGCRNVFHPNVAIGGAPQTSEPVATNERVTIGEGSRLESHLTAEADVPSVRSTP